MSDQDEFLCADETSIQIVSNQQASRSYANYSCTREPKVTLKYTPPSVHEHPSDMSRKAAFSNVEFERQPKDAHRTYSNSADSDDEEVSSLRAHYQAMTPVYMRKRTLGTSWIGNREFFASVFVHVDKLAKADIQGLTVFTDAEHIADSIAFDSDFESGNLYAVYKTGAFEYDLILQNDINTKGNTQWFYFRITNPPQNIELKINIVNFRKSDSLFNYGMLPCVYSQQNELKNGQSWLRRGRDVKYYRGEHQIEGFNRCYYILSFRLSTPFKNDTLRVAQCFPYTVSDLNLYLEKQLVLKWRRDLVRRETVCQTIGQNKIECLIITDGQPQRETKPIIFILARQHPGETPGSFLCEGLLDFFLAKDKESQTLRKQFEIRVVPMVNPDGVAVGNYRSNLYGFDLNRKWDTSLKGAKHESAYLKSYINALAKTRQFALLLDLHGHSRKMFSFFYGNPSSGNQVESRMLPLICSKLSPNKIRLGDCTFTSDDYKRQTARIQLGITLKIPFIYAFQVSFFGYVAKEGEKKHFTMESFKQLGTTLGKGIYLWLRGKNDSESKEGEFYKKCVNQLRSDPMLMELGLKHNSGSESDPEECEVKPKEQEKLNKSQVYARQLVVQPKNVKIVKRLMRKDMLVKETGRPHKLLHVLDIATVNSIFPNDILALVPNSFYFKSVPKKPTKEASIQTDEVPLLKIYQSCKTQENWNDTIEVCTEKARRKSISQIERVDKVSQRMHLSVGQRCPSISSAASRRLSAESKQVKYDNEGPSKSIHKRSSLVQTVLTFSSCHLLRTIDDGPMHHSLLMTLTPGKPSRGEGPCREMSKTISKVQGIQGWRIKKRSLI